jgi:hypothetical protein
MDKNTENIQNDILLYIKLSKEVIDEYLSKQCYREALSRLLRTMEKLDGEDKDEMVKYYINNMKRFNIS